jgi:hypothetical protein
MLKSDLLKVEDENTVLSFIFNFIHLLEQKHGEKKGI